MTAAEDIIASRAAREIRPGMVVNLGVGLPCKVADWIDGSEAFLLHGENGVLGMTSCPAGDDGDPDLVDPGGRRVGLLAGAATFDSVTSFCIVRQGCIDLSIVGGFEVDETGRLANWAIPGKRMQGMGGGMDLLTGARRVVVAMRHEHAGVPKLVGACTLPLTAMRPVDLVVTELGVFEPTAEGLIVREIRPGLSPATLRAKTAARLLEVEEALPMQTIA